MYSILSEISKLRGEDELIIDYSNRNRHRVITYNPDGSKTAYCFSTPIYNENTGKAVNLKFTETSSGISAVGSNADITVTDRIYMESIYGSCSVSLNSALKIIKGGVLSCGKDLIYAAANGIAYKADISDKKLITFNICVDEAFTEIRSNDSCFSLLWSKFTPFFSVSCIGAVDNAGKIVAPARLSYERVNDREYSFTVTSGDRSESDVMFEISLYEPKLIQDSTVESLNPKKKNPFGGVAFIGDTEYYGKQWLCLRPQTAEIRDILNRYTEKIILHIPRLSRRYVPLAAYKAAKRFCIFGASWENRVDTDGFIGETAENGDYIDLDITETLISFQENHLLEPDGIILKPKTDEKEFMAVSTGDCCYAPQIIEIRGNA